MKIEYIKKDDDTIIRRTIAERIFKISDILKEIKELEKELANLPKEKEVPDTETLLFWNEMNASVEERRRLEDEIAKRRKFLKMLRSLK